MASFSGRLAWSLVSDRCTAADFLANLGAGKTAKEIVWPVHRITIRVWLLASVFRGGCFSQIQIDLQIWIERVSVKGVRVDVHVLL